MGLIGPEIEERLPKPPLDRLAEIRAVSERREREWAISGIVGGD